MTSDRGQKDRQIIPRWNLSSVSFRIGDTMDLHRRKTVGRRDVELLRKKRSRWEELQSTEAGIDLVGSALVLEEKDDVRVDDAIMALGRGRLSCSQWGVVDAARGQDEPEEAPAVALSERVRSLRSRLVRHPRDAIAWIDIAYVFGLLGSTQRAERCLRTAIALAPNSRIVLRALARFFAHREDPDTALWFLRRSDSLRHDPWLLAADISIAETFGKRAPHAKSAIQLVDKMDTHPLNKTELLGALSTLEFRHSANQKRARRWLREALLHPNENTLAQAEHLVNTLGIGIDIGHGTALFDFEARSVRAFRARAFEEAIENTKKWAEYQPLSSRPLLFGSYIQSVLMNDNKSAIEFIRSARGYSTYSDPMVINNLAFFLASEGRIEEASQELRRLARMEVNTDDEACVTATRGLIAFRSQKPDLGHQEYERAAAYFRRRHEFGRLALALIFWGRELIRMRDRKGVELFKEVSGLARKYALSDARVSAGRTLRSVALSVGIEPVVRFKDETPSGRKEYEPVLVRGPDGLEELISEVDKSPVFTEDEKRKPEMSASVSRVG